MKGSKNIEIFAKNIAAALKHKFDKEFFLQDVENILCKVFWIIKDDDKRGYDLLLAYHPLANFSKTNCEILQHNGEIEILDGPYILNVFSIQ